MFKKILRRKKGQNTMEFMTVFVLIIGAFLVFGKYISRALNGRWKSTGDMWSHGRQYDPDLTKECSWDEQYGQGWYDRKCFETSSDCNDAKCWQPRAVIHERDAANGTHDEAVCITCFTACSVDVECRT